MLMPTLTDLAQRVEALAPGFAGSLRGGGRFLRGPLEDLGEVGLTPTVLTSWRLVR